MVAMQELENVSFGKAFVLVSLGSPKTASYENVVKLNVKLHDGMEMSVIPVFVSVDHLESFLGLIGESRNQVSKLELSGFDELEKLLVDSSNKGVTHVQFNSMPPGHDSPRPVPIKEVIEGIQNRLR